MSIPRFRKVVWAHYKKFGRHTLPWRKTKDPYRILVSEVMLQQTQVERVIPFYKKFIQKFPIAKKLANASLPDVLKAWQGLGYNRRAKMLHQTAKELVSRKISTASEWEALPGIGPYTARAIAAFAYNEDNVFIETNIRTAVIHHFFSRRSNVEDTEILEVLNKVLPKGKAREWYAALMDYGAYLKRTGISHNAKSRTYTKQSRFAGSLREARGALVRAFTQGVTSRTCLIDLFGASRRNQMKIALDALVKEGLISGNLLSGVLSPHRHKR